MYEDEILKDLEKGNVYTSREIASIVYGGNRDAVILCEDTSRFDENDRESKFKVIDKLNTFIHRNENYNYVIPNSKKVIYVVKKVYS
jgi:hypothetical protein